MRANKNHILVIKSEKPPTIELDASYGSVYIRFKNSKIVNTLERCVTGPVITVDIDRLGEVVGVESVFCDEFQIGRILKKANIDAPRVDFSRATFRSPSRMVEEEEVFA